MLSRTRKEVIYRLKKSVFEAGRFGEMLEESERRILEDNMGFRGQWDEHRRFQFELLKQMGLKTGSSLLEIGCGPLTLAIPVIEYLDRGGYTGVDIRPNVLNLAYKEIAKHNLSAKNPRLIFSESFGAAELGDATFDFVWSFSVLYHLTDEILDQCIRQIARRLRGSFFANVNVAQEESTWLQFPFVRRDVDFYRAVADKYNLKLNVVGQLKDLGFQLQGVEKDNVLIRLDRAT